MLVKEEIGSEQIVEGLSAITDTLKDTLSAIANKENVFYDKELGKQITEGIIKAIGLIPKTKIDLSPLVSVISKQNELIQALLNKKPESNDEKYQNLLQMTLGIISKNTEFLKAGINIPAPIVNISPTQADKRPIEWEHTSVRDKNGNLKTTSKAK